MLMTGWLQMFMEETKMKTKEIDEILDHASMPNEGWTFLGDVSVSSVPISTDVLEDRVSGLAWDSELDTFYGQCRTRSKD